MSLLASARCRAVHHVLLATALLLQETVLVRDLLLGGLRSFRTGRTHMLQRCQPPCAVPMTADTRCCELCSVENFSSDASRGKGCSVGSGHRAPDPSPQRRGKPKASFPSYAPRKEPGASTRLGATKSGLIIHLGFSACMRVGGLLLLTALPSIFRRASASCRCTLLG